MEKFKIPHYTEQDIPGFSNLLKSIILIGMLFSSFLLGQAILNGIDIYLSAQISTLWQLLIKISVAAIFVTINSIFIMGLGILGHEANHGVFWKNRVLNDLCGGICWSFFLMPSSAFREFHLTHHCYTHQPEVDPESLMNNSPAWMSLSIGPTFGLYLTTKILVMNLLTPSLKEQTRGWKDVFYLSIGAAFYFYMLPLFGISLWYLIVPTVLFMPYMFAIRNLSEHHGIPAQSKSSSHSSEAMKVDSWILLTNPLLSWLWSDINYHQVHHRYPYLSHRYLRKIFEETQSEYPYAVFKGYIPFVLKSFKWTYYGSQETVQPFLNRQLEMRA
jgi:fatty acid desaturase